MPINDLDSIGTINMFSATVIWMGLPRQGIYMRPQEILDYLALWRYVAYLMGSPHDWMATPESARTMMESLVISEIRPSKASANLANNIISGLEGRPPTYASREFMCAQTYWLNGSDLAAALEIERPSLYYSALVFGQCLFFATLSYLNRSFNWLDERNIRVSGSFATSPSPSTAASPDLTKELNLLCTPTCYLFPSLPFLLLHIHLYPSNAR